MKKKYIQSKWAETMYQIGEYALKLDFRNDLQVVFYISVQDF